MSTTYSTPHTVSRQSGRDVYYLAVVFDKDDCPVYLRWNLGFSRPMPTRSPEAATAFETRQEANDAAVEFVASDRAPMAPGSWGVR